MKLRMRLCVLLAALLLVLTGCGGEAASTFDRPAVSEPEVYAEEAYEPGAGLDESDFSVDGMVESSRKLNRRSTLQLETLDFDQAVDEINALVTQLGGYMESSYVEGGAHGGSRTANFTCRVPAKDFAAANDKLAAVGNVVTRSQSAEDVTDQYYDVQAELDALKVQQERLLAMMEQATEMADLIALEEELTEVRYRINDRTSAIKRYDGLVEYATIDIDLTEVVDYQELPAETFGDRVAETFFGSLEFAKEFGQGIVLVIVAVLPFAAVYGGIAAIAAGLIVLIVKLCRNKKKQQK